MTSWWLNQPHLKNMIVKMGIPPHFKGENKKCLKPPTMCKSGAIGMVQKIRHPKPSTSTPKKFAQNSANLAGGPINPTPAHAVKGLPSTSGGRPRSQDANCHTLQGRITYLTLGSSENHRLKHAWRLQANISNLY